MVMNNLTRGRNPCQKLLAIITIMCLQACSDVAEPIIDPSVLARGKRIVNRCVACHDMETRQNNVGPHLVGIIGRDAGSVSGYGYTPELRAAKLTWTHENLVAFLIAPNKVVPGTAMVISPLSKAEAEQLVTFLEESQ
jgi:cytochrome c2